MIVYIKREKFAKKRETLLTILTGAILIAKEAKSLLLLTTIASPNGVDIAQMMLTGANRLRNLRARSTTREILLPDRLLNTVHLVLVTLTIPHRAFLGVAQRCL